MFLQTQNTNSDSELKNALFTFTIQCIYNCSDSLFCAIRAYRFWRRKPSKHFETQTIEQLEIPTQKCCINFIIKCFYKLKIQIQTQSSKMLFLHLQFNVFTTVLTHFFVPSGHISVWRTKPSKDFETIYRTARNKLNKILNYSWKPNFHFKVYNENLIFHWIFVFLFLSKLLNLKSYLLDVGSMDKMRIIKVNIHTVNWTNI